MSEPLALTKIIWRHGSGPDERVWIYRNSLCRFRVCCRIRRRDDRRRRRLADDAAARSALWLPPGNRGWHRPALRIDHKGMRNRDTSDQPDRRLAGGGASCVWQRAGKSRNSADHSTSGERYQSYRNIDFSRPRIRVVPDGAGPCPPPLRVALGSPIILLPQASSADGGDDRAWCRAGCVGFAVIG